MSDIELILLFAAGVFFGFLLGKIHAFLAISRMIKEVAEEQGIDLEKELRESQEPKVQVKLVHKLAVEKHGEMLYLFDKEEDSFICQGSSVQELAKLAKQYKNIMYAAVLYGDKVFQFKDGESTEVV